MLTDKPMHRIDAYRMIRRRTAEAGVMARLGCHVFRATGMIAYLEAGGTLENVQAMAAHESPLTTKLYNRTGNDAIAQRRRHRSPRHGSERGVEPADPCATPPDPKSAPTETV